MKLMYKILAVALCAVLVLALAGCVAPAITPAAVSASDRSLLSVSAIGEVAVKPDMATVNLGVITRNTDANALQTENTNTMNGIIAAIKNAGVDEKDIVTSGLNMYPVYNYEVQPQKIEGYEINNTITVTVKDLSKVGDIVNAAMGAGVNILNGITFGLKDSDAAYQEALKIAVEKATAKAQTLASASKVSLASLVSISEGGVNVISPVFREANLKLAADSGAGVGGTIQSGELKVSASVSLAYEIK